MSADVTMMVDIDAEGKVSKAEVTKPVGQGFDEAAREAVLQYLFSPAEIDGKPAAIRIEYTLHFVPKTEAPDGGRRRRGAAVDAAPPPPPPPPDVLLVVGRLREKGTRDPLPGAEVDGHPPHAPRARTRRGWSSAGPTPRGGSRSRASRGSAMRLMVTEPRHEPCIRDLVAFELTGDKPFEVDCLVPRGGAPSYETTIRARKPPPAVTRYELAQPELKVVPGTFGDPLRVVQNLPGVARTPFGLGALVIRGASPNDSGIYVEGHKIPLLYHFLVGPWRAGARADRSHRLFPRQLRRELRARDGRHRRRRHQDDAVAAAARRRRHQPAALGGVHRGAAGGKWSGSISARRSYVDLLLPFVLPDSVTTAAPVYWDYQAGVNRDVPGGAAVAVRVRQQRHAEGGVQRSRQGNIDLGVEIGFHKVFAVWTQALGNWINKLSPAYGYERVRFGVGPFAINESAHVLALRDDLTRQLNQRLTLRVGLRRRAAHRFDLLQPAAGAGHAAVRHTIPPIEPRTIPLDTLAPALYADATWELGRGVTVIPGVRGDYFRYVGQNRFTFDPRLVVRWKWSEDHTWKAGAGIYHQMVDPQLLNPQFGNPNLPPIWADQYSVGFLRRLLPKVTLDTTLYYVRRHDMPIPPPPFKSGGQGRSYGLELILKHEFTERFFGWLAYTLSRSEQTVYALTRRCRAAASTCRIRREVKPTWFPTDFDQTHNLIAVASYAARRCGSAFASGW